MVIVENNLQSVHGSFVTCEGKGGLAFCAYVHAMIGVRVMSSLSLNAPWHVTSCHLLTPSNLTVKLVQRVNDQADSRNACRWSHS